MTISTKMMKGILSFIGVLFLLAPLTVFAGDDLMLMITPALSGNRPLKNVITVAKGNGKFTDPVAAVNSITDASVTNPYLVVIGPGVYTIAQTLMMKQFVDIAGSGENITKITGDISGASTATSAVISGSNHSALSSLTVENTTHGNYSVALYNSGASPTVTNVTTTASGGGVYNYGIYNNSSSPKMTNVTATASGGIHSIGVSNVDTSSPEMTGVIARASEGVSTNNGIKNLASSFPTMTNVTATASGGIKSYGVCNYSSSPVIRRSTIGGSTDGLYTDSGTAKVSQSTIMNGASVGTGTNKCVACDDGFGTALNATCN